MSPVTQVPVKPRDSTRNEKPLQLEIVSEHKEIVGDDHVRVFREDGGTIGRSLENDWILPDPDRFISGKHATIDFQSGAYYLADVSTNGVYVNEDEEPLGKGNPRRLFHGDKIRMGDFEFEVTLDEGESLEMPPPEPMTVVPDHIEQLVDEASLKSGIQMLDEDEITGGDVIHNALFGEAPDEEKTDAGEKMDNQPNPFVAPPWKEQQKRMDAAKHFAQDNAERKEIGTTVKRLPPELLGRHVCWRSQSLDSSS